MSKQRTSDIINEKVDIEDILNNMTFSDEETSEAARLQPFLFITAARFRVQKMRRRQQKEAALKLLRAQVAKKIRTELAELGQRVTDKQVEESITRKKEVKELEVRLEQSEQEEEYSKLLLEGLRMRSTSLKIVSELIGAEVYVSRKFGNEDDTELAKIRKKLKQKYPGRVTKEEKEAYTLMSWWQQILLDIWYGVRILLLVTIISGIICDTIYKAIIKVCRELQTIEFKKERN